MVQCEKCQAESTLDGNFCRQCGAPLQEQAIEEARQKLAELLADGRRLLTQGRSDEARRVADSVLEQDPRSTGAYGLLGDVHEANGDYPAALEAYEKVVNLDPNSPLDRIHLAHLRDEISARLVHTDIGRPVALTAAAASMLLTVCIIGMIALWRADHNTSTPTTLSPADNASQALAMNETNRGVLDRGTTDQSPEPIQKQEAPKPTLPKATNSEARTTPEPVRSVSKTEGTSELPSSGGTGPIGPLKVLPEGTNTAAKASKSIPDPDPAPTKAATPPEKRNRGVVEITESKHQPSSSNPSESTSSEDPANLLRVARQRLLAGDLEKAADAYERALGAGADSASTNQHLGQIYDRLGRKQEASQAYRRAANTYRDRIASGNNSDRNQAGLAACEAALHVLGG